VREPLKVRLVECTCCLAVNKNGLESGALSGKGWMVTTGMAVTGHAHELCLCVHKADGGLHGARTHWHTGWRTTTAASPCDQSLAKLVTMRALLLHPVSYPELLQPCPVYGPTLTCASIYGAVARCTDCITPISAVGAHCLIALADHVQPRDLGRCTYYSA